MAFVGDDGELTSIAVEVLGWSEGGPILPDDDPSADLGNKVLICHHVIDAGCEDIAVEGQVLWRAAKRIRNERAHALDVLQSAVLRSA